MARRKLDLCAMGGVHAVYQVVTSVVNKYLFKPKYDVWWSRLLAQTLCFVLVAFAWIFFRANNVDDAFVIVGKIFSGVYSKPFINYYVFEFGVLSLAIMFLKEFKDHLGLRIGFMHSHFLLVRYVSAILLVAYILIFGAMGEGQFIYFQF